MLHPRHFFPRHFFSKDVTVTVELTAEEMLSARGSAEVNDIFCQVLFYGNIKSGNVQMHFKLTVHVSEEYMCLLHIEVLVICWQQHRDNYEHVICICLFHGN